MILPSTCFKKLEANPLKMKGSILWLVKIRPWLCWNKNRDIKQGLKAYSVSITRNNHKKQSMSSDTVQTISTNSQDCGSSPTKNLK